MHERVVHQHDPRLRFLGLRSGRTYDTERGKVGHSLISLRFLRSATEIHMFSVAYPDAVGRHLRRQSMETHIGGHDTERRPVRRPDIRWIHIGQVRYGSAQRIHLWDGGFN